MVLRRQILFSLAIAAIAEAIMMRTSAEMVPSLPEEDNLETNKSVSIFGPRPKHGWSDREDN